MYASLILPLHNDVPSVSASTFATARSTVRGLASARHGLQIVWRRTERETAPSAEMSCDRATEVVSADLDLLNRVTQRDQDALAMLYDAHNRAAFGVAYRILEDHAAAEDVVQEAFLSVWRQAGSYRPERGAVRTWILAITRNAAIDRRRGRQGRAQYDQPLGDAAMRVAAADDPDRETMTALLGEEVRAALAQLPCEQREVIDLAFFSGLTHQEIAERLGLPLGTVKGRIRLALHKLRSLLISVAPVGNATHP